MQNLKNARLYYIGVWCAAALLTAAFESELIPAGFVSASPSTSYATSMLCIVLTLGCTWGALRLFAFRHVKETLKAHTEKCGQWNALRTSILGIAILANLLIYYGTFSTSALYALLITLAAFVFCWPKQGEVN